MIEIRRQDTDTTCAVCGRTVLLGERLVSFRRIGLEDAMVCELCVDQADARGWTREGAPALPVQLAGREERGLRALLRPRKRHVTAPEPFDPELLPEDPADAVEASLELFNESTHPRTVSGIARTLGDPKVSVVRRSHREVVVTVGPGLVPVPRGHAGRADRDAAASRRGAGRARRPVPRVERPGRARRHRRARVLTGLAA